MTKWVDKTWYCGCGAMNAGWLTQCGKCGKHKPNKNEKK